MLACKPTQPNARTGTLAGARVHCGILFSSVRSENKSSAAAMKFASTVTVVVFVALLAPRATPGPSAFFFSAASVAGLPAAADPDADADGAGVPCRDACADTVRSLPCVSMIAAGNAANLASRAEGRRDLAREKSASTAGERAVLRLHSYCSRRRVREYGLATNTTR